MEGSKRISTTHTDRQTDRQTEEIAIILDEQHASTYSVISHHPLVETRGVGLM